MSLIGRRFVTRDKRDGDRTIEIVSEVSAFRGDRMFLARNVVYTQRPDLVGRERIISLPGLNRGFREASGEQARTDIAG